MGSNPIGLTNVINNLRLLLPRFFARPEAHRKHQAGNSTRLRCKGFTQIDRFPSRCASPTRSPRLEPVAMGPLYTARVSAEKAAEAEADLVVHIARSA